MTQVNHTRSKVVPSTYLDVRNRSVRRKYLALWNMDGSSKPYKVKGHVIYLRGRKEQVCKMKEPGPVLSVKYRWLQ